MKAVVHLGVLVSQRAQYQGPDISTSEWNALVHLNGMSLVRPVIFPLCQSNKMLKKKKKLQS